MMNKLNNKGMTIVEIIVTFVILMVLVLGMLNMTNEIKETSKKKQFYKDLTEYSSYVQSLIQDDLITLGLLSVTTSGLGPCDADFCLKLEFKDGSSKNLYVNSTTKAIGYDGTPHVVPMPNYVNDIYTDYGSANYSNSTSMFVLEFPIYEHLYGEGKENFGFKIVHLYEEK